MSIESWQRWGVVSEVAGAAAVVVTLGFLAVETRANTNALQAETYQGLMRELNDYRALLLSQPDRWVVEDKVRDEGWPSLTRTEQRTLRLPILILWGIYESAYFANERGVLGEREWTRFEVGICRARSDFGTYWDPGMPEIPMTELLTPEFVRYIDATC